MKHYDENVRKELTANIVFMNDENWMEYTAQDKITLIHFLSSVDVVSRSQIPLIRKFAAEYGDKYTVGVMDAGLCPNACDACRIQHIPSMVVMRQNIVLDQYRGLFHEEKYPEFIMQLSAWQKMDIHRQLSKTDEDSRLVGEL